MTKSRGPKEKNQYALYKGDDLIAMGTISELAEHEHVSINTIRFLASKCYKDRVEARKNSKNPKVVFKIEEDDEE